MSRYIALRDFEIAYQALRKTIAALIQDRGEQTTLEALVSLLADGSFFDAKGARDQLAEQMETNRVGGPDEGR